MQSFKAIFYKPDPAEQKRKCDAILRKNIRSLDRDIANMKLTENKTRGYIVAASKRAQRNPTQAKQANAEARTFARELVKVRKQSNRLHTSKAQLESVKMQIDEAFSIRKIERSLKTSTGIMKDVNTLIKLPELSSTMQELSAELMKAGIIDEMVGDMLPDDQLLEGEDEEAEAEIDKILGEVLKTGPIDQEMPSLPAEEEENVEDREAELEQMRGRLEALKS